MSKIRSLSLFFLFVTYVCEADPIQEVFSRIYTNAEWGKNEENIGYSGNGSRVEIARPYMDFLQNFMKANEIKTIVDVGCGDWTFSKYINWDQVKYTGIDVVPHVIEKNKQKFSTPNISFFQGDIIHMDLPVADLMVCKDVLQHLSNEDILEFLKQIKKFKHCLITNGINPDTFSSDNLQIAAGDYRPIDLTKPPFNLNATKVFCYPAGGFWDQIIYIKNDW